MVQSNPEVAVIVICGGVTVVQETALMKDKLAFANHDALKHDRFVLLEYVEVTRDSGNIKAVEMLVAGFWEK